MIPRLPVQQCAPIPIEIKPRSAILASVTPQQLETEKKSAIVLLETAILKAMVSNPKKMQVIKNTALLFIQRMQEAVNNKGNPECFHSGKFPENSFGEIDKKFYEELTENYAPVVNMLCCHQVSPLGDRKITLFRGTNYTRSALKLIAKIDAIAIEAIQNAAAQRIDRGWHRYRTQHADEVLARTQDVLAMKDIHRIIRLSPTARDENGDTETHLEEIAAIREKYAKDVVTRFKYFIDQGIGNCGELAILTYLRLKYGAARENAEIRTIGMSTHCFVMIPHPTLSEKNIIVDPWVKYIDLPRVHDHRAGRQLGYRPEAIKNENEARQHGFCGTLPEFTAFLKSHPFIAGDPEKSEPPSRSHPLIARTKKDYEFKKRESPFNSEAEEREVYEYMMAKIRAANS